MAEEGERRPHRQWLENVANRAVDVLADLVESNRHRHVHHHVYVHVEGPITVRLFNETAGAAARAILTIKGSAMPGQITVDTTNETATIGFVDDKGDVAAEPDGAAFEFSSDNEAVASVAADADNPLQADITPNSVGTANISATSNGTAMEGDGVTPIPDPAPVQVTVSAGAAAGESFTLSV